MLPSSNVRLTTSPEMARAEKERRQLARRNFPAFCEYVDPRFESPAHIKLVAAKLQQVAIYIQSKGTKGIGRLMIMMPPRHGKSELASRKFPAWLMGVMPDTRVIMTSYAADLAVKHSRAVRDLLNEKRYKALFGDRSAKVNPVELSSDSRSVSSWDLMQPNRGGMVATGVGGGVTGLGADLLIGDDLFKNREEAESDNRRELVDDWWKSSAHTRLQPFGAIILFFTRWHPDDQVGRLIKRQLEDPMADQWEIIFLPALALDEYAKDEADQKAKMMDGVYMPISDPLGRKPGQALWPERFDEPWLAGKRANIKDYDFEALYQQMPFPKSGQHFKRAWLKTVNKLPEGVTLKFIVRYWDKAASSNGDFTVGVLMGYGSDGMFYVLDVVRGQWTSYERDQKMRGTLVADHELYGGLVRTWHQQDPGSAGLDSAKATNRLLMGFPVFYEPVTGDKATRAGPLESACQGDLVRLLKGAWNEDFINEYGSFDRGKYDDQVDAGSSCYNKLVQMISRPVKEVGCYEG